MERRLLEIYVAVSLVSSVAASMFFLVFINMVASQGDGAAVLLTTIAVLSLHVVWPAYIIILVLKKASKRNRNLIYLSTMLLILSVLIWIETIQFRTYGYGEIAFAAISALIPLSYLAVVISGGNLIVQKCNSATVSVGWTIAQKKR